MPDSHSTPRLPRPVVAAIAALAAVLVVGVIVVAAIAPGSDNTTAGAAGGSHQPYAMPAVPAPKAGSKPCDTFTAHLPKSLANGRHPLQRRALAKPAPPATAAWGGGQEPVTLRCGVQQPGELTPTSRLLDVSGVQWLEVPAAGSGSRRVTAYAVDRPVYVALTMPTDVGTGPLQDVSAAIRQTLKPVPVRASNGG